MVQLNSNVGTFVPDKLIAGNQISRLVKSVTLKAAQGVVKRGTVLGIITTGGLAVPVDSTKADGSQTANCILCNDVDTTGAANIGAEAYKTGHFNRKALIFGGTDTAANHETTLRGHNIHLSDNIAY